MTYILPEPSLSIAKKTIQRSADCDHTGNGYYGNERGDYGIFYNGRSRFIAKELKQAMFA
jgi:hypothetical protein